MWLLGYWLVKGYPFKAVLNCVLHSDCQAGEIRESGIRFQL